MHEILSITLQAMRADMARLDQVALNLANAGTPGYRRETGFAPAFGTRIDEAASHVQLDLRQGTLQATGGGLDLALSGPGWFEIALPDGPAYTRQGNFRTDAQGRLVTLQGHPVMGTAGEVRLPPGPVAVDAQGRIYPAALGEGVFGRPAGEPLAQLNVVRFEEGASAHRLGGALVRFEGAPPQPVGTGTEVRQGHLENANVSSMHEMVQLLQAMRHFESMQKVALGYDDMLAGAIRRLGENN